MVKNMNRNSIRWRLPASYGVIAFLAALSLGSLMLLALRSYYADQEHRYLLGNAIGLQPVIEQALQSHAHSQMVQDQITGRAFLSQTQIRLLDTEGNTIADSGTPDKKQFVAVAGTAKRDIPFFASGPATLPEEQAPIVIYSSEKNQISPEMIPFDKEIPFSGPAPQTDMILSINAS